MKASSGSIYLTRPDLLLRLEGLLALVVGCIAYQRLYPHHWGVFVLLFLAPDVSLLGYLRSANKTSAAFYNLANLYLEYAAQGSRWSVAAWINNAFNATVIGGVGVSPYAVGGFFNDPRLFGLSVAVHY